MNIRANLSWVIIMKQILTKVPEKVSVAQKSGAAIQRTFHQYRGLHFTYFIRFFLRPTYLIFKFNLVFIK